MPENQTDKSRYPSRYSVNKFVTGAQYVTEYICEKKAKKEKRVLPSNFWDLPEWNKFFRHQIVLANRLLKKYSVAAIVNATKRKEAWWMTSLGAPKFEELVIEEYNVLKAQEASLKTEITINTENPVIRPTFNNNKSIRGKLE